MKETREQNEGGGYYTVRREDTCAPTFHDTEQTHRQHQDTKSPKTHDQAAQNTAKILQPSFLTSSMYVAVCLLYGNRRSQLPGIRTIQVPVLAPDRQSKALLPSSEAPAAVLVGIVCCALLFSPFTHCLTHSHSLTFL